MHARKTRCVRGHAFADANLFLDSDGHRHCRQCKREREAALRADPVTAAAINARRRELYGQRVSA
jgi:hypothetical protein